MVLRRLMNEAQTVSDTIAVENQLASVQGQIDEIQGRLRYLADQTALSTITVEMRERGQIRRRRASPARSAPPSGAVCTLPPRSSPAPSSPSASCCRLRSWC